MSIHCSLQLIALRLQRCAVGAEQPIEDPARIVFGGNGPAFEAIRDGARAGQEARACIDRENQGRLAAVLLGVQGDDLIERDGVVDFPLGDVQGGSGEPHVRTGMRVGLRSAGMVQAAEEAELIAKRAERFGRLAEDELAVFLGTGEPTPFIEAVFFARQRHAIGRVDGAETARRLIGDFGAHGVEHGQSESHAAYPSDEGSPVDLRGTSHGALRLLLEKRIAMDDESNHVMHPVAVGS